MSYPIGLDEIPTRKLLAEIARRDEAMASSRCPYCNISLDVHSCKYWKDLDSYHSASSLRTSVLQDWVMKLPLRGQGTLLTIVRGCDLVPKFPLDSTARTLTACLRHAIMNPADPREVDYSPGAFFMSKLPENFKPSELGHYPQHWISHIMHGAEVIGYLHPDPNIASRWLEVYRKFCHSMHVPMETKGQLINRLTEDRIASGTVVS